MRTPMFKITLISMMVSNSRVLDVRPWFTQINYAWQVLEVPAGHLYIALPLVLGSNPSGVINSNMSTSGKNTIFFTPGVGLRVESRDFVTRPGLGGYPGRNHPPSNSGWASIFRD
jgi:hypothetical protein